MILSSFDYSSQKRNLEPGEKRFRKTPPNFKAHQPGDRDDVRDAAHSLAQDVVGDAEGLRDGQRGVDGVEEAKKGSFFPPAR